jgi:hypothetical protein
VGASGFCCVIVWFMGCLYFWVGNIAENCLKQLYGFEKIKFNINLHSN